MATSEKPNILFIMADQMAAPVLSIYDKDSPVKTPNLDRLAKGGVVFDSAYCNSPLCAPSRFTLVTGQLPSKIGAHDNASELPADIPTFSHYLRNQGYHTALSGKMHYIGPDQLHGYEERLTTDIYPGDYGWTVNWDEPEIRADWYHNMSSVLDAGPVVRTNQLDYDDEVIFKANQWLYDYVRRRNDKPFFLTVSMTHPHDPYANTKEFWDLYENVEIPLPRTAAIPYDQQDPHSRRVLKCIDLNDNVIPDETIRRARRAYFASCSYVDAQIGKVLATLKDCGLEDDTIIVFSGDHGDMLGERGLWYKMVFYEMSMRVPMLVYKPGLFKPRRVKENVSTMDLMPTLVALGGGVVDPGLPIDGVSLVPYLTDDARDGPRTDTVIGEYTAEGTLCPIVMIRRGRWKFVYSPLDPPMLYDLDADPLEHHNLVPGVPPARASMTEKPTLQAHEPPIYAPKPWPLHFNTAAVPTPPLTPDPQPAVASSNSPSAVLNAFLQEVQERWDFNAWTRQVVNSQRRRRIIYAAHKTGRPTMWDYTPPTDGLNVYVRNMGTTILDDVEYTARWPRVPKT